MFEFHLSLLFALAITLLCPSLSPPSNLIHGIHYSYHSSSGFNYLFLSTFGIKCENKNGSQQVKVPLLSFDEE